MIRSIVKSFLIGISFTFGFIATSVIAVSISSTFTSGEKLTAAALNELKDAIVAMPNWTKGSNSNNAVYNDGKVGIGTNPTETLEVNGTVKANAFVGDGSGITGITSFSGDSLDVTGTITAGAFVGDGSGITGITSFSGYYTTGSMSFSFDALHTYAHGLGGVPSLVVFEFVCTSANNGYSVGDRVPFTAFAAANSGNRSAGYNATHVFYAIDNPSLLSGQKSTGTGYPTPSPSQWQINVHAWR